MRIRGLMGAVLVFCSTANVQAQEPVRNESPLQQRLSAPSAAQVELAPRLTPAEQARLAAPAKAAVMPAARGRSVAYMIAGAALLVGGAIIGSDAGSLLMVGGVVIGAYGVFLHFR